MMQSALCERASNLLKQLAEAGNAGASSLADDVTALIAELEYAQTTQRLSHERFRAFVEQSAEGIWCYEIEEPLSIDLSVDEQIEAIYRHGYLAECNNAMARMYGLSSAEEIIGARLGDLLPQTEENVEYLRSFMRSGYHLTDGESCEVDRFGETRYFLNNLVGILEKGFLMRAWGTQRDITERVRAEAARKESEERYRVLFENAPIGIYRTSPDGQILMANPALLKMLNYSSFEEIAARNLERDWYESSYPRSQFRECLEQEGHISGLEVAWTTHSNKVVFVRENATAIRADDGSTLYYEGTVEDITAHRQAEDELAMLAQSLKSINECVTITDLADRIIFVNNAFLKTYGYEKSEVIGKSITIVHSQQNDSGIVKNIASATIGGSRWEGELLNRKKDGTEFPIHLSTSQLCNHKGEVIALVGVAEDITERKQAEEALRQSEERYRTIIENMHDAYFEMDLKGNLTFFNNALCILHRRSREELIGRNNRDYMDAETANRMFAIFKQVYDTGQPVRNLTWKRTRPDDGERWFEISVSLIRGAEGKPIGFRGISREITEQILNEEALQKSKEAAEAANRAKSEFLANMSHEIRTPMNGIIGMTELALETQLSEDQRGYLNLVKSSAESLMGIINDILDFSKIETGKMQLESITFDLRDMLADTLQLFAVRARRKRIELVYNVSSDVPAFVIGDPMRLRQVIVNLVGNAIKFTDKGEVVIRVEMMNNECRMMDEDKNLPSTSSIQHSSLTLLRFSVSDTGIGIPADKQRLIFDPFTQADGSTTRKYGGTGLGLTITSQLVKMMGGEIRVESEVGSGSEFSFMAKFGIGSRQAESAAEVEPVHLRDMPVLVVDDNATNRRVLETVLTNWNMKPRAVESGPEAIAALKQAARDHTPFQLVLLDYNMPEMDGFSVAREIRATAEIASLPIVMLSSSDKNVSLSEELEMAAYLTKPVKQSELLDAMLGLLGTRPASQPSNPLRRTERRSVKPSRILLAEDSAVNQQLVAHLLKRWGHEVESAGDGFEALEALERQTFDLVLMDVQMPRVDGFEATTRLREREKVSHAHIPVIALTAHAMTGDRERCLDAGMDAYLSKPIEPDRLFEAIEQALRQADGEPLAMSREQTDKTVDLDTLLSYCEGDRELAARIVQIFLSSNPAQLTELRLAVESEASETIMRAAHTIKGAVGNFGAAAAFDAAMRLEAIGRDGRLEVASEAFAVLEKEIERLKDALVNFQEGK